MRLWSLHPRYLDAKGLVALWREGLLARKVLRGKTRGYRHHPQLKRFQEHPEPLRAIDTYLQAVREEADLRGYHFDGRKLRWNSARPKIGITSGQVLFEFRHLMTKLKQRDAGLWRSIRQTSSPLAHPFFRVTPGPVELWEKR